MQLLSFYEAKVREIPKIGNNSFEKLSNRIETETRTIRTKYETAIRDHRVNNVQKLIAQKRYLTAVEKVNEYSQPGTLPALTDAQVKQLSRQITNISPDKLFSIALQRKDVKTLKHVETQVRRITQALSGEPIVEKEPGKEAVRTNKTNHTGRIKLTTPAVTVELAQQAIVNTKLNLVL